MCHACVMHVSCEALARHPSGYRSSFVSEFVSCLAQTLLRAAATCAVPMRNLYGNMHT